MSIKWDLASIKLSQRWVHVPPPIATSEIQLHLSLELRTCWGALSEARLVTRPRERMQAASPNSAPLLHRIMPHSQQKLIIL